jgi:hypothetical protein
MSKSENTERRRSKRRTLLDTFSFFVVVPKKGIHRLPVHDLSEGGIRFDLDLDEESPADFPVEKGEILDLRFYFNQALYLPLRIRVARIIEKDIEKNRVREIGAEFCETGTAGQKACTNFLQMLDQILDLAQLDQAEY